MKDGSKWSNYISDLLETNGPEWTVNRLKAIFTMSLHLRNGNREMSKNVAREASIAYTRAGFPKHALSRKIVKRFVESKNASSIKRSVVPLRVYTMITLKQSKPSKKQVLKAVKTISTKATSQLPSGLNIEKHTNAIMSLYPPHAALDNQRIRRDMTLNSLRPFTSTYVPYTEMLRGIPDFYRERPYFKAVASLMTATYVPAGFEELVPSIEIRDRINEQYERISDSSNNILVGNKQKLPGKIFIIQEGGCKARTVAIPNAWVQMCFAPLHRILSDYTENHFGDISCVRDQTKGIHSVLGSMEKGQNVHSIDLSAATDRFPLEPQLRVLETIGLGRYSEALQDIVEQPWDFPQGENFGYDELKYEAGQPMGLYGSFALFNLTHILLANSVKRELEIDGYTLDSFDDGTSFKIIGDDIVTCDATFAEAYKTALAELGVEVSPSKTFSGEVAEFAGFLAVKASTTRGVLAFKPYKYPKKSELTNPINFLDAIGSNANTLSKKWQNRFEVYNGTRNQRKLDLSPIFDTDNTAMCGITGNVTNHDVAWLRRNIQMLSKEGDLLWPTRMDWGVRTPPCVETGNRSLVSAMKQAQHVPTPENVSQEKDSNAIGNSQEARDARRIQMYRNEAKRFNQDPLVKEQVRENKLAEMKDDKVDANPYSHWVVHESEQHPSSANISEERDGTEQESCRNDYGPAR